MSTAIELTEDERKLVQERIRAAAEAKRKAAVSGDLNRAITDADLAEKPPADLSASFDAGAARSALANAATYDAACTVYNDAVGADLAPGDFQARCRRAGLPMPSGFAVKPVTVRPSPTPQPSPAKPAKPAEAAGGKAARQPWIKAEMRAACDAEASWPAACARYNAATGQARTWQRFRICCLTAGIRPDYPRARSAGSPRSRKAATRPKAAPAIAPAGPREECPPGPFRPPAIDRPDFELLLAGVRMVAPLGIDPATLRKIADLIEAMGVSHA